MEDSLGGVGPARIADALMEDGAAVASTGSVWALLQPMRTTTRHARDTKRMHRYINGAGTSKEHLVQTS